MPMLDPKTARLVPSVPGLPHVMLIELRQALISYQDYHMLLLTLASLLVTAPCVNTTSDFDASVDNATWYDGHAVAVARGGTWG